MRLLPGSHRTRLCVSAKFGQPVRVVHGGEEMTVTPLRKDGKNVIVLEAPRSFTFIREEKPCPPRPDASSSTTTARSGARAARRRGG